jgi:hypothetical protein
MTDHSILRPALPDLPFQQEARIFTAVLTMLFVTLPRDFANAMRARQIYQELYVLDSPGLAALGIEREAISRAALEQAGMVSPKSA